MEKNYNMRHKNAFFLFFFFTTFYLETSGNFEEKITGIYYCIADFILGYLKVLFVLILFPSI